MIEEISELEDKELVGMKIDQDRYELAVCEQFEKLAKAQTTGEIKEVLDTWPEEEDYSTVEVEDESR